MSYLTFIRPVKQNEQPSEIISEINGKSANINEGINTVPVWLVPTYSKSPAAAITGYLLDVTKYTEKVLEDIVQDGTGIHRYLRASAGYERNKINEVKLARGSVPKGYESTDDINQGRGLEPLYLIWKTERFVSTAPEDGSYIVYNKLTKQTVQTETVPSVIGTKVVCGARLPVGHAKFKSQIWTIQCKRSPYSISITFKDEASGLYWGLEGDYPNPEIPHKVELMERTSDTGRTSTLLQGRADNDLGFSLFKNTDAIPTVIELPLDKDSIQLQSYLSVGTDNQTWIFEKV